MQAFALDKTPNKGKFEPKAKESIFIGYSCESKAYRLWDPASTKVIRSRDVKFIKDSTSIETADSPAKFMEFEIFWEKTKTEENSLEKTEESSSEEKEENSLEKMEESILEKKEENSIEKMEESSSGKTEENNLELTEEGNVEKSDKATGIDKNNKTEIQPTPFKRGPGRPRNVKTGERGRPRKLYNLIKTQPESGAYANYETN
ncbi:copia protein, partial [Lasius niger]